MRRAVQVLEVVVGPGAGIVVADQHGNGASGGSAFEYARQDLHAIGLCSLSGEAALAGPPTVKVVLQVFRGQGEAGWAAVDHHTDPGAMALAPRANAEQGSEGVSHGNRA